MTESERKRSPLRRVGILLVAIAAMACVVVFGINKLRHQAKLAQEQSRQEWRQKSFDAVKEGGTTVLVMDSKLLPMLANDADCKKNVTCLDFASTEIDKVDATAIAGLPNVTSITFYCTTGTEHVLLAAKALPIIDLHFEMPDLPVESYLKLKDFPHLEHVRFEHVMDDEWIERLETELLGVTIDAPFPRSQEPGSRK